MSFSANHQDEFFMSISIVGNVYTQPFISFQENNSDECFVQIPVVDSVFSLLYASFSVNNQNDFFMQIFTLNNRYTSFDALITSLQLFKDTLLSLELSEDIENFNVCSHKRTH